MHWRKTIMWSSEAALADQPYQTHYPNAYLSANETFRWRTNITASPHTSPSDPNYTYNHMLPRIHYQICGVSSAFKFAVIYSIRKSSQITQLVVAQKSPSAWISRVNPQFESNRECCAYSKCKSNRSLRPMLNTKTKPWRFSSDERLCFIHESGVSFCFMIAGS